MDLNFEITFLPYLIEVAKTIIISDSKLYLHFVIAGVLTHQLLPRSFYHLLVVLDPGHLHRESPGELLERLEQRGGVPGGRQVGIQEILVEVWMG